MPNNSDMFRSILEVNKKFKDKPMSSCFGRKNDCPENFTFDGYIHIEAFEQCLRSWFSDESICVHEMTTGVSLREILESTSDQPCITIIYGIMNRVCETQDDQTPMLEEICFVPTEQQEELKDMYDMKFENVLVIDDCCVLGQWSPPEYAVFCPMLRNCKEEICPVTIDWLDLQTCIGESSSGYYLKRAVNVWKVTRSDRDIHVSTNAICKSDKVGRKVEVKVTLSKGYRFNDVFGPVTIPTRKLRFPESCQFEDSFRKRSVGNDFWKDVAQTDKTSFPCAYNMGEETHEVGGNIYARSHKNMLCEFSLHNNVNADGTCGYQSIVIAITSCPRFLARFAFGRKEEGQLPLTVDALKLQIGEYITKRLNNKERKWVLDSWKDKLETIQTTDPCWGAYQGLYQQLKILDDSKNEEEKEDAREWIINLIGDNDLWMDEGLVMVIEMIYRIKVLVVKNPKQPKSSGKSKSGDPLEKAIGQCHKWTFQPFLPQMYHHQCSHHFIILNNYDNDHFDVFISNHLKRGVFTWEEIQGSPTIGVLFQEFIVEQKKELLNIKESKGEHGNAKNKTDTLLL